MFGLEDQKKKKKGVGEFTFDLEKELQDEKRHSEMKKEIDRKVQRLKEILRGGESKEDFNFYGLLLQAYVSLQKVLFRAPKK